MASNSFSRQRLVTVAMVALVCGLAIGSAGCAGRTLSSGGSACAPACGPCALTPTADPCPERPPHAKLGEAWCRIWIPPVHQTVVETVCVCPAQKKKVRIPAEYGTRPKLVCVQPPKLSEVVRPGVWKTKKRDVMLCPERDVYERVCCPPSDLKCGELQRECWKKKTCPPVFRTECQPICVAPPKKCVEFTPARYKCVDERFLLRPARCEEVCEPARYETRTKEVCVTPGRWEWRRNRDCEVPEEQPLPALEVEMVDSSPSGKEEGVFRAGSTVRYNLTVRSDVGSQAMPNLKVVFILPPQLEFVSGGGEGVTVSGSGQSAASSIFPLALKGEVKLHILAKVISVPPTTFVQTTASVQTAEGDEVARETESTSLTDIGSE